MMIESRSSCQLSHRRFLIVLFILFSSRFSAQEIIYHGKIIRGDDGCPTMIKIKSAENGSISHHLIMPTGHLPEHWHYGQKITFTMTPLRQPIPAYCEAQVVASIQIMLEEKHFPLNVD